MNAIRPPAPLITTLTLAVGAPPLKNRVVAGVKS